MVDHVYQDGAKHGVESRPVQDDSVQGLVVDIEKTLWYLIGGLPLSYEVRREQARDIAQRVLKAYDTLYELSDFQSFLDNEYETKATILNILDTVNIKGFNDDEGDLYLNVENRYFLIDFHDDTVTEIEKEIYLENCKEMGMCEEVE